MKDEVDWTLEEVEAAVADYFQMLSLELQGEPFNKAAHNRHLQTLLQNRSRGSVEWKHQNISAALVEIGFPYIEGYKPGHNLQNLLREVVAKQLSEATELRGLVEDVVERPIDERQIQKGGLPVLVEPPRPDPEGNRPYLRESPRVKRVGLRDYLEIEARNTSLGRAGEELILRFEHERLWRAGERNLADRIEHVSQTQGDGLGFDILSFETNGKERLIEVKTTGYGSHIPFFASKNEVAFSEERNREYQLYRLFGFGKKPRLFTLPGSLKQTCVLDPMLFAATVK